MLGSYEHLAFILANISSRNKAAFNLANSDKSYEKSVYECFENSDYIYGNKQGNSCLLIGFQRTNLMEYNVWMAISAGTDKDRRFIIKSCNEAGEYFTEVFSPSLVIGTSIVHKDFKDGMSFLKHWGFTIESENDNIVKLSRMFGG